MAKSNRTILRDHQEILQQPSPPGQESNEDEVSDIEINLDRDDDEEISEGEEQLARAVFGDSAGFREGLRETSLQEQNELTEDENTTGLEGLDDAQLFFTDTGDVPELLHTTAQASGNDSDDDTLQSKHAPAWEDSDDERTMVSLASIPRLRKLRRTELEDLVTGKDYARRLRKQFELLHPAPEWARFAIQRPAKKKRRLSENSRSDENNQSQDEMDLDDELPTVAPLSQLLQDAQSLVRQAGPGAGKKRKIRPEVIDIQRQKDIGGVQPSAITSLSFHPKLPLLLSSGPSATMYLHQLASSPPALTPNPLLTSLHVRGSQLTTTAFHPTDSRIFLSARRRYFHVWDLSTGRVEKITRVYGQQHEQKTMEHFKISPDGNYMALLGSTRKGGGVVNILDAASLQWMCQVRIESRNGIADFSWWRTSTGLCVIGKNGEVTEWSIVEQKVIARWQDEGAVGTTTVALGGQHELAKCAIGNDRWIAIGSSSGIVNIYDRRAWFDNTTKTSTSPSIDRLPIPEQPKPTKIFDHLTTPTSHLSFSHDGQIMAMASKWKRDSMRLVHLPSCTVFKNWPTSSTPLGRITGVAFAAGDVVEGSDAHSVLAVANEQGKIRMWEIR